MSAPISEITRPSDVSPLAAFTGDINRTKLSLFYTIGLAVVAFAMVFLPAVYIALIALTAWGVLYQKRRSSFNSLRDGAIETAVWRRIGITHLYTVVRRRH
jgi:hypothetical protein